MKIREYKFYFIAVAIALYFVGQYFRGFWWPNFTWPFPCDVIVFGENSYCDPIFLDTLGWPLIAAGKVLAIAGIIVFFANESGFRAWWRFSRWYIPVIAVIIIFFFPLPIFPVVAATRRDTAVVFFGAIYILITLGITIWGLFSARRKMTA